MSDGVTLNLYTKPGCPWCMQATTWLDAEGYDYREIDVIADESAFDEMKALSGQSLAPTLVIDEGEVASDDDESTDDRKILPDFSVDDLKLFLAEHGIAPSAR